MGANFLTMRLDGDLTEKEVVARFEREQEQDRYENGHLYSGGFGMARGLKFESGPIYGNVADAEKHLDDSCQKWEVARAVKYRDDTGLVLWLIGAVCAS